jgi:hypothetical protein
MRSFGFASFVVLAIVGCSAASSTKQFSGSTGGSTGTGPSGQGGSGSGSNTGGGLGLGGNPLSGAGSTGSGTPGCTTAATLVYVLSPDNTMWSFDPPTKTFTNLFTLDCPTPNDGSSWAPNSMAVDRNVVAWVNYVGSDPILGTDTGGLVYKVDINARSCTPTPAVTLQSPEWYRLGMGYSTDTVGGATETLYVTGTGTTGSSNSPGLGKIDLTTKTVVPIGQFSGDAILTGQSAELTGTGDAKLFGFFTTNPIRVAQLDKGTGAVLSDLPVTGVATPMAWAFSFWGGAFYLYTSNGTANSKVTRFDPATKAVDATYTLKAPVVIVGAGVSTCAPIAPPT